MDQTEPKGTDKYHIVFIPKKVHIRSKEIVTMGTGNGSYGIWRNIKRIGGFTCFSELQKG